MFDVSRITPTIWTYDFDSPFAVRDSEKGLGATEFMMRLIKLRRTYNLTIVVIAHTPKRDGKQPITQFDLAGSSKLISFFDAGIAIGRSAKDKETKPRQTIDMVVTSCDPQDEAEGAE